MEKSAVLNGKNGHSNPAVNGKNGANNQSEVLKLLTNGAGKSPSESEESVNQPKIITMEVIQDRLNKTLQLNEKREKGAKQLKDLQAFVFTSDENSGEIILKEGKNEFVIKNINWVKKIVSILEADITQYVQTVETKIIEVNS
jgi:hypothetical protein